MLLTEVHVSLQEWRFRLHQDAFKLLSFLAIKRNLYKDIQRMQVSLDLQGGANNTCLCASSFRMTSANRPSYTLFNLGKDVKGVYGRFNLHVSSSLPHHPYWRPLNFSSCQSPQQKRLIGVLHDHTVGKLPMQMEFRASFNKAIGCPQIYDI